MYPKGWVRDYVTHPASLKLATLPPGAAVSRYLMRLPKRRHLALLSIMSATPFQRPCRDPQHGAVITAPSSALWADSSSRSPSHPSDQNAPELDLPLLRTRRQRP